MILAGAPVPEVITLVVIMVMGDLMPGLLVTPGGEGGSLPSGRATRDSAGLPPGPAAGSRFSWAPFQAVTPAAP